MSASTSRKPSSVTRPIHAQRRSHDCGVAALASYIGTTYEDMYVAAAAASESFLRREGLTMTDMQTMARSFGRHLDRVDYRRVDLEEHIGILGVNWDRSQWKRHGASGHWVLLRAGTIIDPSGPSYGDATDYLAVNKGRAGTLLRERGA
jgi:ABC-type bacteriocin/lantibiotic exporter with double-glycine peptidase domain